MNQNLRAQLYKLGANAAVVGVTVITFAKSAVAAVPTEASTALTTLGTDAGSMQGLIWAPLITLAVGWKLMSMFKKGANKI